MVYVEESAESIEDFLGIASKLRDDWFGRSDMAILPWFRGHKSADWQLVPKFYREGPYGFETECEIREEFINHAPALSDIKVSNEWEWYFLMQHYGAPTRLLDWTDGALFGLYFAVRKNMEMCDAAVWVLDPWWLNDRVFGAGYDQVICPGDPAYEGARWREHKWLPPRTKPRAKLPKAPIAVFPGHFDKRVGAQRSSFTVHGADRDGLLSVARAPRRPHLVKIIIPARSARQMKRALDTCGIDETTVFPNLDALIRVVEFRWKHQRDE